MNDYVSGRCPVLLVSAAILVALTGAAYAESVKEKISAQEYERNYDECLDGMSFICKKELLTQEDAEKIAKLHSQQGKASTLPAPTTASKKDDCSVSANC